MRVILYSSSSFGGCYDYALQLLPSYAKHPEVKSVKGFFPSNATCEIDNSYKFLIPDEPPEQWNYRRKLHFLFRVYLNPILLFFRLRKEPASWVVFNDFEQLSAWFWVPLFKWFLRKHKYAVVLHDPDRDNYPPSKRFSAYSMQTIMSLMDLAFFHEFLPKKPYYKSKGKTRYMSIPHGTYPTALPNSKLKEQLLAQKSGQKVFAAMIGNIRQEKNYHLAIEALGFFPQLNLIVAGSPANSRVNLDEYKQLALEKGVDQRMIWIEKFLDEDEISAIVEVSDIVLLIYSKTFTSQSGILNLIARYKKRIVASDGSSSLSWIMRHYNLGVLVEPDSLISLVKGIETVLSGEQLTKQAWDEYLDYANWDNHVKQVVKASKSDFLAKEDIE
jgi:glycosyltransferase involved in cell wall biosynthesis